MTKYRNKTNREGEREIEGLTVKSVSSEVCEAASRWVFPILRELWDCSRELCYAEKNRRDYQQDPKGRKERHRSVLGDWTGDGKGENEKLTRYSPLFKSTTHCPTINDSHGSARESSC